MNQNGYPKPKILNGFDSQLRVGKPFRYSSKFYNSLASCTPLESREIYEEFHRKTCYIHFGQFEIFEI